MIVQKVRIFYQKLNLPEKKVFISLIKIHLIKVRISNVRWQFRKNGSLLSSKCKRRVKEKETQNLFQSLIAKSNKKFMKIWKVKLDIKEIQAGVF